MTKVQYENVEEKEFSPIQEDLIEMLKRSGPMCRTQMVGYLKRPRSTIYDNLSVLIDREVIKKFKRQVNSRGRPIIFFKLREI